MVSFESNKINGRFQNIMRTDLMSDLTSWILGLFSGSLLTEALLLVPYWRSLKFDAFYELHSVFGPRLFRYFAPLTAAAIILSLVSAGRGFFALTGHDPLAWTAAGLSILVLSTFFAYFGRANQAFAERRLSATELEVELARWHSVHNFRTLMALLAFAASILAAGRPIHPV